MSDVKLPRDAEGREIPLDTKVLYSTDVLEHKVDAFEYSPRDGIWRVALDGRFVSLYASDMHLTPQEPPDSWERLVSDLELLDAAPTPTPASVACAYWDATRRPCRHHDAEPCSPCSPNHLRCYFGIIRDVLRRIKALREGERDGE